MKPLVSVIVPVYNMETYIQRCVESVLSQTYSNIEIIIINDGSTDETENICSEIVKKNKNVFLINQKNSGVSEARNNGICYSSGEYIFFLDADDFLFPNSIKKLLVAAISTEADMAIGRIYKDEMIPQGMLQNEDYLIKTLEDNPISYYSCRILYKKSFIKDIFFLVGYTTSEDSFFVFECALKKPKVIIIPEQVYSYTINHNSASRSFFTRKKYVCIHELLLKKEKLIQKNFPQLLPLFNHLKVKTLLMLLHNFANSCNNNLKKEETETLKKFKKYKNFYRKDLPYSDVTFYNICALNLYKPFKFIKKIKKKIYFFLKKNK